MGNPYGRARLRQLLRNMPAASRQVALRRLDEEPYCQYFEAEFGKLPQHKVDQVDDCEDSAEDEAGGGTQEEDDGPAELENDDPQRDPHSFQELEVWDMNMDPGCTDSGSDAELRQEGEGPEEKLNDYSDSSDSQDKGPPPVYHQVLPSESRRPAEPKRRRRHAGQVSYAMALKACRALSPPRMQGAQPEFNPAEAKLAACSARRPPSALLQLRPGRRSFRC